MSSASSDAVREDGDASAVPSCFIRCRDCGRALSAHWARKHRMGGRPICNCCRAAHVPLRPVRLHWTGATFQEERRADVRVALV